MKEGCRHKTHHWVCMQTSKVARQFYASLEGKQAYTDKEWHRWQNVHPAAC